MRVFRVFIVLVAAALAAAATLRVIDTDHDGAAALPPPTATGGDESPFVGASTGDVVVSLPFSNRLAIVDPVAREARLLPPFDVGLVDGLSGTAERDGKLLVVGSAGGQVSLIDLSTGKGLASTWLGVDSGWFAGRDGSDFVVSADDNGSGRLIVLEGESLRTKKRYRIGSGQSGMAISGDGQVWTIADEASRRIPTTTVSVTDLRTGRTSIASLPGQPEGISLGPQGRPWASLLRRDMVVELSETGKALGRVRVPNPWGISIGAGGRGVVVSRKDDAHSDVLHVIDFNSGITIGRIDLGSSCPNPRDVVIARAVAVITCTSLPGVALVDIKHENVLSTIRMVPPEGEDFASFEEPRIPTVITGR